MKTVEKLKKSGFITISQEQLEILSNMMNCDRIFIAVTIMPRKKLLKLLTASFKVYFIPLSRLLGIDNPPKFNSDGLTINGQVLSSDELLNLAKEYNNSKQNTSMEREVHSCSGSQDLPNSQIPTTQQSNVENRITLTPHDNPASLPPFPTNQSDPKKDQDLKHPNPVS